MPFLLPLHLHSLTVIKVPLMSGFMWSLEGVDSFYEYLFKAHILFGKEEYWRMFKSAYVGVQKYFRHGPW